MRNGFFLAALFSVSRRGSAVAGNRHLQNLGLNLGRAYIWFPGAVCQPSACTPSRPCPRSLPTPQVCPCGAEGKRVTHKSFWLEVSPPTLATHHWPTLCPEDKPASEWADGDGHPPHAGRSKNSSRNSPCGHHAPLPREGRVGLSGVGGCLCTWPHPLTQNSVNRNPFCYF